MTGTPQPRRLTREDVMTVAEVAELLGMPKSTVYCLAKGRKLPAVQLGRAWRFLRSEIEATLTPAPA